ncbi:MAG TPA: penicillin acylase family protein [Solirubrobacteraceae bacterium]|nr:penicillin acylase family protein [Solirubrobacteraceae bacterium]
MRRGLLATLIAAAALLAPPAAQAAVQPYGTNDAGGFRNVLPPGEAGTDNAIQLAQFEATGARPAHWDDQQPLYENLLYASPTLTHDQIGDYFKDATFGVPDGQVASTESPEPGVTIVRDKAYGVPHIYGDTDEEVEFGAGYAAAEDRLFLMDVLRHTGRAELSSFIGGSAGNREMDRTQWAIAPYTEADLQSQIDDAPKLYGAQGQHLVDMLTAYVAGINAYIAQARLDPTKLPAEYAAIGKLPQDWTGTDVIATASLIGGIFGKGGGAEVKSAQALEALVQRFGTRRGRRAWSDFRSANDPEADVTVLGKRFPYETTSAFAKRGLALPDPGSVKDAPVAPPVSAAASAADSASFGAQLLKDAAAPPHASNWLLIAASRSANGHPIGVLGPQVGYYVPQILMEEDLHGPSFDARGATFPGVNLMVQLGHGRDYAWSATTSTSDNIDTFAEVLCQDDFHYLYKGQCLPMERLDRTNSWTPNADDMTPSGSETLTAWRTVHGIVYARGTVHGQKVAFVSARTTYFHEADSAIGFFELNDPHFVTGPDSFRRAVGGINFLFNWGYLDSQHTAYQMSGWLPERAKGTSPDFPILGTGQYDWQAYDPATHTEAQVPLDALPHVVDQPYTVSWNNKQAPGWAAADDQWAYGPIQRQKMLVQNVRRDLKGGRKMTLEQLVSAMEEGATQDIRVFVLKWVERAMGHPSDPALKNAIALLNRWKASGGHRRDLNKDGRYDDDDAVTLMDAWWPRLVRAEFGPALGTVAMSRIEDMLPVDDGTTETATASAPAFFGGWWGYMSKDLRDLLDRRTVKGPYSRTYCGNGSRSRCRQALRASLKAALGVTRAQLYGQAPECKDDAQASCFDMNRSTIASGIGMPPFPFQNRPTFQQTVEVTRSVPR